jgi:nucleoside-diphosphate-sugar epimerase
MRKPVVLITGAGGEIGHALIQQLDEGSVLAIDIRPLEKSLAERCYYNIVGDILDTNLLERLVSEYEITAIYHLAALLSTRAEYTPEAGHRVNVQGTINLLHLAIEQSRWQGRSLKFIFPSSIAVYGLPDLERKASAGRVEEWEWTMPTTMYGCNKLYCEHLGRYYADYYRQLAAEQERYSVDFRGVRFPGLISAITMPTGGTSDYAPEMIHAAASGKPYACFVREDTVIPFMAMADAIKALRLLADARRDQLTQRVYNVTSFSPTAGELRDKVLEAFPGAEITFEPDLKRQGIIDTWPAVLDDMVARRDWGWSPDYDFERTFSEYLIPTISKLYA